MQDKFARRIETTRGSDSDMGTKAEGNKGKWTSGTSRAIGRQA